MATIPNGQKILTSAPEVNTTYGGSASLQALNTWYTMGDISNTVRPYKVFTALLTQSGGDNYNDSDNFPLEIGVTYTIIEYGSYTLGDFTNVGAPNNEIGTSFIATNTTPNSWGTNIGLSWNGGAPVVKVLENTIGNIWCLFEDNSQYSIRSNNLFIENKTIIMNGYDDNTPYYAPYTLGNGEWKQLKNYISDESTIGLKCLVIDENGPLLEPNSIFNNWLIEIRVYN